ncbi:hypothetical protein [Romboutsia sp.]|uniref:hypothetical protein n=1 Tax=Romboutsia sp. TaxID=1965302 RepID=UPI002D80E554|nr:hypothetical protein [Romboutsia sp.]
MSSNIFAVILFILGLLVPGVIFIGSILLLIIKIIERKKEKKNEDLDKYDKY